MLAVSNLAGIGGVPRDKTSAIRWLERHSVSLHPVPCNGGTRFCVSEMDLPSETLKEFRLARAGSLGKDMGTFDDAAHRAAMCRTAKARNVATRRADLLGMFEDNLACGVTVGDAYRALKAHCATTGQKVPSLASVYKWRALVDGVDRINWPFALVATPAKGAPKADMSEVAWATFLDLINKAWKNWPLMSAWLRVEEGKAAEGWQWPSYSTVVARWNALSQIERDTLRLGKDAAVKKNRQSQPRKLPILSLQWVALDGRTQDFWVHDGDGVAYRPTMLALVDIASLKVIAWKLGKSENAVDTVSLIVQAVIEHGIFDNIYTDNGRAFSGKLVAGGLRGGFRRGNNAAFQPPGVCKSLGINIHYALPANAQAKLVERAFATLSRAVDDCPEFAGAHAGHSPSASNKAKIVPVHIDFANAVVAREIKRINAQVGRKGQNTKAHGSYDATFEAQKEGRVARIATPAQIALASLEYAMVKVDRHGRFMRNGWTYGQPCTQDLLVRYHKSCDLLVATNPKDFNQAAVAFDSDGTMLSDAILPVIAGEFDDKEGARNAARNAATARKLTKQAEALTEKAVDIRIGALQAKLGLPSADNAPKKPSGKVVKPLFNSREARAQNSADIEAVRIMKANEALALGVGGNIHTLKRNSA